MIIASRSLTRMSATAPTISPRHLHRDTFPMVPGQELREPIHVKYSIAGDETRRMECRVERQASGYGLQWSKYEGSRRCFDVSHASNMWPVLYLVSLLGGKREPYEERQVKV